MSSFSERMTQQILQQPRSRSGAASIKDNYIIQNNARIQLTAKTPYTSGRTTLTNRGYAFEQSDPQRMHLGVSLKDHQQRLRGAFVITAVIIMSIETLFLAWPITATAIWTIESAINWVWYLYLVRIGLLFWAIATSTSLAIEKLWGMGTYKWTSFYRVYGTFAPSGALIGWSSLAFAAGCVLGGIATIVSAAIYTFYTSDVLYGLSIGIGVLAVIESFLAPFVLYHFGIIIPVKNARELEMKRMRDRQYVGTTPQT
jgi:hypothetical protein